jgi:hypothetical protein
MSTFTRYFYGDSKKRSDVIDDLRHSKVFTECLSESISIGEVFPTLRRKEDNAIDFYCSGARLCRFKSSRFVDWHNTENDSLFDNDKWYEEISEHYKDVVKRCVEWGNNERGDLSRLYNVFSPYIENDSEMILLDIEVGFPVLTLSDVKYNNTQIDALFLDTKTSTLYFVEIKEANDSRIKVTPNQGESAADLYERLEVARQIEKYRANLSERKSDIISAYTDFLSIMQEIFGNFISTELKKPLVLYPNPKLLVYGNSTENGKKCLEAIRSVLGNDLIELENRDILSDYDFVTSELRKDGE